MIQDMFHMNIQYTTILTCSTYRRIFLREKPSSTSLVKLLLKPREEFRKSGSSINYGMNNVLFHILVKVLRTVNYAKFAY